MASPTRLFCGLGPTDNTLPKRNPPEWTHKVPEVTPLGFDKSPYPDRTEAKPGIPDDDLTALLALNLARASSVARTAAACVK